GSSPTDGLSPARPVKVGETWAVDASAVSDLLGKGAVLDSASGEGKLIRVYEKDGKKFGVLELTVRLSLKALGVLAFRPPGVQERTIGVAPAIDGGSTAGLLTATSRLSGKAAFEDMGKKLSVEIALTPSVRQESSAEVNPPPGRDGPPATEPSDNW